MDDVEFLKRIVDGYLLTYRKHLWHTSNNYADMTAADLSFFTTLGQCLGYTVRREMNWHYPRDLCWCESVDCGKSDSSSKTIMYLERENRDPNALHTVTKMLDDRNAPEVPYLIALFGWVRPSTQEKLKDFVRTRPLSRDKKFLMISWIGQSQNGGGFKVEGWINVDGVEYSRMATPDTDKEGYWLISADSEWSQRA